MTERNKHVRKKRTERDNPKDKGKREIKKGMERGRKHHNINAGKM